MKKNFLIIIPARGGSKSIPRKNIRILDGKPLIYYAIKNGIKLKNYYDIDLVVDTDSDEIADVASLQGAKINKRPPFLGSDEVALDPVINNACLSFEKKYNKKYDVVITMQATSPTLKSATLIDAINKFENSTCDTMISVVNDPCLTWKKKGNKKVPVYEKRVNRQELPPNYKETGAFLITKREFVNKNSRIGNNVSVYELPLEQSIDIDNYIDWNACRTILKRKNIVFRCDSDNKLGMGHIYRCLSIAYHLTEHNVIFVTDKKKEIGVRCLEESAFNFKTINNNVDFYKFLISENIDIVVNDILDTEKEYIENLKNIVPRVVNFEDKGLGANYADCVINSMFDNQNFSNRYFGYNYFFIRDEFLEIGKRVYNEQVKNILFTFGGSDPLKLSTKSYNAVKALSKVYKNIHFNMILGKGNNQKNIISDEDLRLHVYHDVKFMSRFMKEADLAVSSCGRTTYELAHMAIPTIAIAQNERELSHEFASQKNGFINLGYGDDVDEDTLICTIDWLIKTPAIRKEMYNCMLSKDFTKGQRTVIGLILGI